MKLAKLPSWDIQFATANWFLTITPSGFESPVTNEIIAKSKNIMMMGSV